MHTQPAHTQADSIISHESLYKSTGHVTVPLIPMCQGSIASATGAGQQLISHILFAETQQGLLSGYG